MSDGSSRASSYPVIMRTLRFKVGQRIIVHRRSEIIFWARQMSAVKRWAAPV